MSLIIKELSKEFAKRKVVHRVSFELKQNLSEYRIYKGNPRNLMPADNYIVYYLITPLFKDEPSREILILQQTKNRIEEIQHEIMFVTNYLFL